MLIYLYIYQYPKYPIQFYILFHFFIHLLLHRFNSLHNLCFVVCLCCLRFITSQRHILQFFLSFSIVDKIRLDLDLVLY